VGTASVEHLERRRLLAGIVITRGGTYTGTWENLADRTPVVSIRTTEPVVIQNATIRGKGHLIQSTITGANVTVRKTTGIGVNPNVFGVAPGRFLDVEGAKNLIVQENYLENTAGIFVLGYDGNYTTAQTVRITHNRAKNIDGRKSNGAGGWLDFNVRKSRVTGETQTGFEYAQFVQLNKVQFVPGVEIAWNEVVNEVGNSRVEDVVSIYKSSGTETSPIRVHDNLIDGAFTLRPWQADYTKGNWRYDWSFSGGGILLGDGFGSSLNGDSFFVKADNNTVVGTTNYGIATAAGHDTEISANRVVSSGRTPDGSWNLRQNVGIYVWDSYGLGPARFFDNVARNNTVGWVKTGGGRNDWWSPHDGAIGTNTHLADPVTRQTELDEAAAWRARRYPPSGNIAGTIFRDVDGDGLRDVGDTGATGFTAWLDLDHDAVRDANEPTSKSSSTGRYRFDSLAPGSYRVRVVTNAGWRVTTAASALLTVTDDVTTTRYFGVTQTATVVTGAVFMDANKSGVRDPLESGLPGWRVYVDRDGDGVFDAEELSTLTNAAGKFSFIGLPAGIHEIRVTPSPNYRLIQPSSGFRGVSVGPDSVIGGQSFALKRR
jgi:hypothetical protein